MTGILVEMDVNIKKKTHLFNDVKSTGKNEWAFLWWYKKEVLMDFNETEVACILFLHNDSKVECIIP